MMQTGRGRKADERKKGPESKGHEGKGREMKETKGQRKDTNGWARTAALDPYVRLTPLRLFCLPKVAHTKFTLPQRCTQHPLNLRLLKIENRSRTTRPHNSSNHALCLMKVCNSSHREGNFRGNQLLDVSISVSPSYPSMTNDLHVRGDADFHQNFPLYCFSSIVRQAHTFQSSDQNTCPPQQSKLFTSTLTGRSDGRCVQRARM